MKKKSYDFLKINPGASKEELNLFQGFQTMIQQFEFEIDSKSVSNDNKNLTIKEIINEIENLGKSKGIYIQLFDTDMIFCAEQIYHAIYFAEKAFLLHKNISNSHAIEYLLYTSLQRQIKNALSLVGFKMESTNVEHGNLSIIIAIAGKNIEADIQVIDQLSKLLGKYFNASQSIQKEVEFVPEKIEALMQKYQITNYNLHNALRLRNITQEEQQGKLEKSYKHIEPKTLQDAIVDCLIERMVFLSVDNN